MKLGLEPSKISLEKRRKTNSKKDGKRGKKGRKKKYSGTGD